MENIKEKGRIIPIRHEVDVLVVGGGVAGIAAAISAARMGVKTLLIERYGFLGGMATAGLVITVPPMEKGLQKEIANKLEELKAYVPLKDLARKTPEDLSHVFDPEVFKVIAIKMLKEAGAKILLHSLATNTVMKKDVIRAVIIENKEGRQAIVAKIVIDATGDADIAYFSKAPYIKETVFPLTLMFNIVNVNVKKFISTYGSFEKLRELIQAAIDNGELHLSLQVKPMLGAPGIFAQTTVYEDELNIWGGNLVGVDGTKIEDLTLAEIVTREQAITLVNFLKKRIAGFENSRIVCTATQVGIRETRRIDGEYTLTLNDLRANTFKDVIAKPFAESEIAIPYRCILPKKVKNLLVVGRCISATSDALVKLRLIPACIATGQAGGVAAALSVKQSILPKNLNIKDLQNILKHQGLID